MNVFKKLYAKIFQKCIYIGCFFLNFREPKIIDNYDELLRILKENKYTNILILSNNVLKELSSFQKMYNLLKTDFKLFTYFDIETDPTISVIEKIIDYVEDKNINLIITIGGGSVIDAGKVVAARLSNKKQTIKQMKGLLKIKKPPISMIAVPTTAGTGSECTVAAVVTDDENLEKYAINDPILIPKYAILDPTYLYTLPPYLTSTIGMDALTHAIEAYIGSSNTKKTQSSAIKASILIKDNLLNSYLFPNDYNFRYNMQQAAYLAGIAFTRAYVGYVHAISHAIAAKYHLPHGYLNAIILPVVLESYGQKIHKKMGALAKKVFNLDQKTTNIEATKYFINYIKNLLNDLNIKNNLNEYLKEADYKKLITHINKEVYPLYPVPKYFSDEELINIFNKLKNNA